MKTDLLTDLNEHLRLEFRAAHEYLAMSIWLSAHDLPGFSAWMRQQSSDELGHANRVIEHLLERSQPVKLPAIPEPPTEWPDPVALVAHVLRNEQEVTASITALYEAAERAGDRAAQIMLQWFVNEQMEEESSARALLGRLKLAGSTGLGLLLVDQELATGNLPGAATVKNTQ
jgi:ferritin